MPSDIVIIVSIVLILSIQVYESVPADWARVFALVDPLFDAVGVEHVFLAARQDAHLLILFKVTQTYVALSLNVFMDVWVEVGSLERLGHNIDLLVVKISVLVHDS